MGGTLLGGTLFGYPQQGTPQAGNSPCQGTPQADYPPGRVPPSRAPPLPRQGTSPAEPGRVPPPPPVSVPWHSGKCCKALWDMGTLPVDRQMEGQTRVKTLPFRRTTYAGGKYKVCNTYLIIYNKT